TGSSDPGHGKRPLVPPGGPGRNTRTAASWQVAQVEVTRRYGSGPGTHSTLVFGSGATGCTQYSTGLGSALIPPSERTRSAGSRIGAYRTGQRGDAAGSSPTASAAVATPGLPAVSRPDTSRAGGGRCRETVVAHQRF